MKSTIPMAYIFLILSKYELFHANGKPLLTDDLMQFETNHDNNDHRPKRKVVTPVVKYDETEYDHQIDIRPAPEGETIERKEKIRKIRVEKTKKPIKTKAKLPTIKSNLRANNTQFSTSAPIKAHLQPNLKNSASKLEPTIHFEDFAANEHRKFIQPRHVNVIFRTKNRGPRVVIRRYKPVVGILNPSPYGHHYQRKRAKQQRRRNRKRRRYGPLSVQASSILTAASPSFGQASCANTHSHPPEWRPNSASSWVNTNDGASIFDGTNSLYDPRNIETEYEDPSFISQPTKSYHGKAPTYDHFEYVTERLVAAKPHSTEIPFEETVVDDVRPSPTQKSILVDSTASTPYEVDERINSEEVEADKADTSKYAPQSSQEEMNTDEEPEIEPVQYEEIDMDDPTDEDGATGYESDIDEPSQKSDSTYLRNDE